MAKKIITFVMLSCLWLSATDSDSDDFIDPIEARMNSAKYASECVVEVSSMLGLILIDSTLNPINSNYVTTGMLAAAASTLLPDAIEKVIGKNYRDQFVQAAFVAGLCLAPQVTIGTYAAFWLAKKTERIFEISPLRQQAFNYLAARAGGALSAYYLADMHLLSSVE